MEREETRHDATSSGATTSRTRSLMTSIPTFDRRTVSISAEEYERELWNDFCEEVEKGRERKRDEMKSNFASLSLSPAKRASPEVTELSLSVRSVAFRSSSTARKVENNGSSSSPSPTALSSESDGELSSSSNPQPSLPHPLSSTYSTLPSNSDYDHPQSRLAFNSPSHEPSALVSQRSSSQRVERFPSKGRDSSCFHHGW